MYKILFRLMFEDQSAVFPWEERPTGEQDALCRNRHNLIIHGYAPFYLMTPREDLEFIQGR